MKVQEIILRAIAKKITWLQAAQIIGISARHMRGFAGMKCLATTACLIVAR